jgi:hypothetical protein
MATMEDLSAFLLEDSCADETPREPGILQLIDTLEDIVDNVLLQKY